MDEFKDQPKYADRLNRDKASVEKKKATIQKEGTEPTKKARILEAIAAQQIELSSWFGDNTFTIVPAEYDDLFHGIDLALEIRDGEEEEYLALGVDVTSSAISMRDKLRKIKDHIADGTLTTMDYFHSEDHDPEFYGSKPNILQVVIGTEGRTVEELSELWMTAYGLPQLRQKVVAQALSPEAEQSQRKAIKQAKEKLGNHRVQILLLEQIKMQLTVFKNFAIQKNQIEASEKISSLLELIELALKEKNIPDQEDVFKNNEDKVFQALVEALNDFDNL